MSLKSLVSLLSGTMPMPVSLLTIISWAFVSFIAFKKLTIFFSSNFSAHRRFETNKVRQSINIISFDEAERRGSERLSGHSLV